MDTWLFRPPVLVGERIVWLGSGSGLPQGGVVRWIGKLPEMGPDWTVGVELDSPLPYGGIDGTWGSRHLFTCEPKHGLLVPLTKTIKECELYQWSKESIENNLKYGNGGTELFAKVQPGPSPSVSRPQTFPTPLASASKLVTSEEPRPAVRRRKRQLQEPVHDVQPATQQPKAPKRKVKSEVFSLLPKIDESNKENSRSPVSSSNTLKSSSSDFQTLRSSPNDYNTVRSSPNDFDTVRSSPNDFNTVTSSPNDFNTVRSSPDDFSTIRSSPIDFGTLKSSSNDFNTLKSSLNDYNTLKTCTSGDYSDYQWFDAKDEKNCNLDYKNCVNEPFKKQCHVIEGQQIRIIKENSCQRIEVKTPNHGEVQIERMSEFSVHTRCDMQDDDSSYEDAAATVDGFYPEQFRERSNTDSASRREKTASGFFSFLRWFRKGKDDGEDNDEEAGKAEFARGLAAATVPSSPELVRSTSSSCGSIDTIFSTATVSSFAFVSPTAYRPFGSANQPEKRIAVGPDTDTYRNRLQQRDRLRELDRNLTLKKKYHLFGSGTIVKSGVSSPEPSPLVGRKNKEATDPNDHVTQTSGSRNSTGRKKRKAPDPPDGQKPQFSDNSLPNSLDKCRSKSNSMDNGEPVAVRRTRHRRTVSDSAKDKKAGAYCHVKGKRKAPQPPTNTSEQGGSTLERFRNQFASFGKKKRPAPQPPEESKKKREIKEDRATQSYQERSKSTGGQFSQEEKERLIANIAKLKAHADRKSMSLSPPVQDNMNLEQRGVQEHVVCNDSLKLERGVLKPNKELPKMDAVTTSDNKGAPVSPRPWYKRSLTNKDGLGGLKRDIFKSLEKKKDREKDKDDEWMPEAGIPRIVGTGISSDGNSCSSTSSKFNIFARLDRSDDKKKEGEKRKSQVSMLANISELDREAAEIVQKEQAREQALMAAHDAKFYSYPDVPMIDGMEARFGEEVNENVEVPKRSSARELISLFNAIGNVTKVTVNSSFFSKDGSGFFSKEGIEKRFSFMGESVRTTEQRVVIGEKTYEQKESVKTNQSFVIDSSGVTESASGVQKSASESSQSSRVTGASDVNGASAASGVTIEEIEDDLEKSSRSRAMYEANKSRRHHSPSPSIPTIAEQSETASSVATTPASTLSPHPGSNRSSGIIPEDAATGMAPDALQHAKRITIWSCPRCTLENPRWKITCDACGRWRPSLIDEKQDSPKCDEPFQRPTSPLHDVKKPTTNKVQVIKMELSKKGSGINWEEELKRYLPRDGMQPTKNASSSEKPSDKTETKGPQATEGPGQSIAKISVDGVQLDASTPSKVGSGDGKGKSEDIFANKSKATAAPSTFIGGKLKQDKDKETKDTNKNKADDSIGNGNVMVNGTGPTVEEPDVDEVRKARLAFFKKTSESNDPTQSQVTSSGETFVASPEKSIVTEKKIHTETNGELYSKEASGIKKQIDENEQMKLREMLKEMKNSLPKRPKKISVGASKGSEATNGLIVNGLKEEESSESTESGATVGVRETQKLGAIKKVPQKTSKLEQKSNLSDEKQQTGDKIKLQNGVADDDKKAEALFITKTTVYEDIKVKKSSGNKPMKVSTSVQTSAVMRKIEPGSGDQGEHMKPPSGKSSDMVPVTVEEFSTTGIKDGVLYTSLSKDSRRIGKGTFELIKARDFASIEATKTSGESTAVHVYANVPSSPSDSTPSEQKSDVIKNGSVTQPAFPSQQPTSVVKQSSEPTGNARNESEKVQGKIQKEKITQSVEKKPPSSGETSRATSSITSPDSDSNKGGGRRSSRATSEASNYSAASISSGDYSEVERLTAQLTLPKGIADFKADLQAAPPEQNMNTLAINRLLRRLEAAIAGGQHNQAAVLAKDLARLKISCSVTRQRRSLDASPASVMVDMYVEDKVSHQGPIPLQVIPTMTVAQLKEKVEEEFEIPVGVQRWILGKMLASDDSKTLQEHNVNSNGCPMFLYLVAPDGEQEGEAVAAPVSPEKRDSAEPVAQVQRPPPPEADRPGGWYYNDEEDRYSFCEDTESEMTDDERDGGSRGASPVKDDRPAKSFEESNRKAAGEADIEEEDDDDDDDDDEDDNDDDDGDGGLVGASAVVIHEKPVVLQAPLVGRPFVKPTPPFLKANTGQQTDQQMSPSSSQASQVRRPLTPQETAGTSQAARHVEQKTGTLQLGWKCPVCTLVNSPTRPGCAACTTERPLRYVVPVEYRASEQELQRMKQEQQVDNELLQVTAEEKRQEAEKQHQHYLQLVNLDNTDLVPSVEPFECSVCLIQYGAGDGVVLRDCLHIFCRPCLANTVQFNEEAEVKCPYRDADYACNSVLQEREIKALVPPDVYEQHLAKSVAQAENKIGNAFHCKTPDCRGWCIFEDNVNEFRCPVCRRTNCLTCQAIHDGMNCKQYQEQVKQASETNAEARRTKEMLEEMVERGEAMNCPTCQVILMKKWGCDWLRCSMCKTEICWVTRGPRWGPGGKGDTTGGCQCGVNGVKCHPRCNYCH